MQGILPIEHLQEEEENQNQNKTFISNLIKENAGILPRTADFIFEECDRLEKFNSKPKISLSAMEIYNEQIFDLFSNVEDRESLSLFNSKNLIYVKNLTWKEIKSKSDIIKLTKEASETRRTESTIYNSTSSRSHAVYQLKIEYVNSMKREITGLINIVDLAGSEKCSLNSFSDRSKEEIESMKKLQNEANFINKSLTALGRVISLLADKKSNKNSIPYRDSKLTSLLQVDFLLNKIIIIFFYFYLFLEFT